MKGEPTSTQRMVTEAEVKRSMVSDLIETLFQGITRNCLPILSVEEVTLADLNKVSRNSRSEAMSEWLSLIGVWLVTYLMHSTILLGGVGLSDYFRCIRSNTTLERFWRVAMIAGLVTATIPMYFEKFQSPSVSRLVLGKLDSV